MKINQYITCFVLSALLTTACGDDTFERPGYYDRTASTRLGQQLVDGSDDCIGHVKSDSETRPVQGVSLLRMGYLNNRGQAMQLFLYKVSLGDISIRVTLPGDRYEPGALGTLTEQAAALEDKSVYTVWGAVSGGAFGSNGQPAGILCHEGAVLKETADAVSEGFFAILDDGQAVCLASADFVSVKHRILEAVGGESRLLENGYRLPQSSSTATARTAVGVSEDGGEVYLLTVDGSDFYYSNGINCDDMAALMKGCGAHNALTLNSGQTVTAVWRNERLSTLFDLLNKPANKGIEAPIANGLAIVER